MAARYSGCSLSTDLSFVTFCTVLTTEAWKNPPIGGTVTIGSGGSQRKTARNMRRRVSRFHGEWLPRKPPQEHREEAPQSGVLPEIRLEGESVVFYLDIATASGTSRLVLRCDADGNVWASAEGGL